jgi:hypothetical protein
MALGAVAGCVAVPSSALAARSGGVRAGAASASLTTSQVISALAKEGVGVYAAPQSKKPVDRVSAPVTPIRVLRSQAAAYAAETVSGTGVSGAQLSALAPMPVAPGGKRYPSFDYLVAAYASGHSTSGERVAHKLLATADLSEADSVVFPDLVLTLLSADVYRAANAGRHAAHLAVAEGPPAYASGIGSLCSTLSDWVSKGFNSLVKTLTVGSSSNGALNFIGGLWNTAVSLAPGAISDLATVLKEATVGAIERGVATAALVSWAVSAVSNLKVATRTAPPSNQFGVSPAAGNPGAVTIQLGKGGFEFPEGLTACANDLDIKLPSFNKVAGRSVNWNVAQVNGVPTSTWCATSDCDLATEDTVNTQTTLNSEHTATLNYTTNTETTAQAAGGLITNDFILVTGTVSIDKQELADLIKRVVLGDVPGGVRVVVGPLVASLTSALAGQIAGLAEPKFSHYVRIEHHGTPCLVGNWTITAVNDGEGPGAGATIDWGSDGVVVADYDGSGPAPNGGYFTGTESSNYTLAATDGSGTAGTFNETPLSGGLTYHDGTVDTFIGEDPLSGQWTCSSGTSTITEERANGTDTWTEQRQTP